MLTIKSRSVKPRTLFAKETVVSKAEEKDTTKMEQQESKESGGGG